MTDSAPQARGHRRRRWIAVSLVVVLAAAVGGGVAFVRWLLPPTPPTPSLPAALAGVPAQWPLQILIPTVLPKCYTYATDGASVVHDPQARGELALHITFAPQATSGCPAGTSNAGVVLTEAPALDSLSGAVSTVSYDRLQLARTVETTGGTDRVTLQWHCLDIMCRLTATQGTGLSQSALVAMATSVVTAGP